MFLQKKPHIIFTVFPLVFLISFLQSQTYLIEDFSAGQMPPTGWSIENVSGQWTANVSNFAGGNFPEARFQWFSEITTTRLISPEIDLTGMTSVFFQFRHMYDDYDGLGPSIGIATRSGMNNWTVVWEILPDTNVGPELLEFEISNSDVGQPDFQVCCFINGNLFNLDYWYVDEILLYRPYELAISLFLEGPYYNGEMNTDLNSLGLLPLLQPYSVPPWNYMGNENVSAIPNSYIIDWILVELVKRNQFENPPFKIIHRQAAFLLNDGSIKSLDGLSNPMVYLDNFDTTQLYIHHRNHLSVMSATPLELNNNLISYDFTIGSYTAYHGNFALKELTGNLWGIMAGDGNADGQINNVDKNEVWFPVKDSTGYFSGDYNLDGEVNIDDIELKWTSNAGKAHWIPDTMAIPFICGDLLIDIRDGEQYQTVQIDGQCWMKENLNYEVGTNWCYYNNVAYCNVFGRLYTWTTIMNGQTSSNNVPSGIQGICPEGWHLPSDSEWCNLFQFADSTVDCGYTGYTGTDGGTKLKSTFGWSTGGNGTDDYGFTALPGGMMGIYHFDDIYLYANFWSCTQDDPGYAWNVKLSYGLPKVGHYFTNKARGLSVRCLKD